MLKLILIFILLFPSYFSQENNDSEKEVVIVLHGLARGKTAMWLLSERLEDAGFKVIRIDYKSINVEADDMIDEVTKKVNDAINDSMPKIHFLGHSLGGLMIRSYLSEHHLDNLGRVVIMGSPSKGTEIVDKYKDRWWMKLLGEVTLNLGTDEESIPNSIPDPYYSLGVIAGKASLSNDAILPGEDDGVVRVESAKVDGMTDMIVVESNHSMLRYKKDVAYQSIHFLKYGFFDKSKKSE